MGVTTTSWLRRDNDIGVETDADDWTSASSRDNDDVVVDVFVVVSTALSMMRRRGTMSWS